MNINLANIDFIPGQGGGGSVTPDEQEVLDTLVNPSDGVLNTAYIKSEGIMKKGQNPQFTSYDWYMYLYDVDGEIYCRSNNSLFKYNPETLSFDLLFNLSQYGSGNLWKDNSGRLYEGVSNQIDIENETVTSVDLGGSYVYNTNTDNIYKGKYGIYILYSTEAYKFNEETQKFEVWSGTYTTDYTDEFYNGNIKEYDGHIIIVKNGSFYELVETEDSITITSVDPYFNTTLPSGNSFNSYYFYKVGDNYYYFVFSNVYKLVNNEWIDFKENLGIPYILVFNFQLVSSNGLFILFDINKQLNGFILLNLGTSDYKKIIWNKISNIAVDLTSEQQIYGTKYFDDATFNNLRTLHIGSLASDITIDNGQAFISTKEKDINLDCNLLSKNDVPVPVIDDIIINKTYIYPGNFLNEVTTEVPIGPVSNYVWTTPSGRLFVGNFEWDFSTSNWIERSFNTDITDTKSRIFTTSFGLTYIAPINYGQIYVWNDSSSNWDLKYENPDNINISSDVSYYWVYGGDLYYGNDKKFDPNNLEWISGEYCTNFQYAYSKCNIGNDLYVRDGSCAVFKYNSSTKTFDRIAQNEVFCDGFLFKYNNDLYINNNESVFKYNTSTDEFNLVDNIGVFDSSSHHNIYFEFDGKLYSAKNEKIGYLYDSTFSKPEVPASDGTYTLKAVRVGDQITYNWVLDA